MVWSVVIQATIEFMWMWRIQQQQKWNMQNVQLNECDDALALAAHSNAQ